MNPPIRQFSVAPAVLMAFTAWSVGHSPIPSFGYAIGDGAGGKLAHQWISHEGWQLFQSQFGASEIDGFLGAVAEYPGGGNNRFIEGAYDEDVGSENPWGETQPSLRHFWDRTNSTYVRQFDDGLFAFDSAANRSIKFFSGGDDLLGAADGDWGTAQGAAAGRGIAGEYALGKGKAYYWLGHVAHLLQDVTLPAHAHNDDHLELGIPIDDPDPLHDWVDGVQFSIAGAGVDGRPAAQFNDTNATRYTRWSFDPATGGVGRDGGTQPLLIESLRNPFQFTPPTTQEAFDSIPANAVMGSLPLYHLFLGAAGLSDDFDSRDEDGQVDLGNRRDDPPLDFFDSYDEWSLLELDQVADVVVPRAMFATAELIRFFYREVDATPPAVNIAAFSGDPGQPESILIQPGGSALINVLATAMDPTSGVNLDGFRFTLDKHDGAQFNPFAQTGATPNTGTTAFANLGEGLYRVKAENDNGGGLFGTSPYRYFHVTEIPEPASLALLGLSVIALWRARAPERIA